jgi:signal transduction histidine kinase/DNA-binding response OmpR family regulator/ligand-binding sensor domain-containing protein
MTTFKLTKILFLLCIVAVLQSQERNLRFTHLSVNDGLSQNFISCLVQDSLGFMWFGTKDGLNRYDGYSFKVFRNDIDDSTSISDNYITNLFVDSKNNLWVGTRNGLNLYDQTKESFRRTDDSVVSEKARLNEVYRIREDNNGNIWAAYSNGRIVSVNYNPTMKKLFKEYHYESNPAQNIFRDFIIDDNGDFWIAYVNGLWKAQLNKSNKFSTPAKILDLTVRTLIPDEDYILCGADGRVLSININNADQKVYNLFGNDEKFNKWSYSVNGIIKLDANNLFAATAFGLVQLNIQNSKTTIYRSKVNDNSSLSSNNLLNIYLDNSQNLWIGTGGYGINKSSLLTNKFEYYPANYNDNVTSSILLIREDAEGEIWFTNMGSLLFKLNRETGEAYPGEPYLQPKLFYDFYSLPDGSNLRAEANSINFYDKYQSLITTYQLPLNQGSKLIFQRFITVDGNDVWFTSLNSLIKFNLAERKYDVFPYPIEGEYLVLNVYKGNSNDMWIATESGLFRYNIYNSSWQIFKGGKDKLSNERVKSLCYDPLNPDKFIWIGTDGGGLNRLDLTTNEIKVYTTNDGLPNGVVYGILTDDQNNLWLSTNSGLSCFNPITEQFKNYNVYDGLQDNEFNSISYLKASDGKLYFGGINGITVFNPNELSSNNVVPNIFISSFKLFNKEVSHKTENTPLNKVIGFTKEIDLAYYQNSFSFSFTALDFTAPQNNKYKYMLEGFDETWIDIGKFREAYYTNIPPGDYTFRVAGTNNDNIWNEKGTSVKLSISPPYWATWWAYIIYAILFAAGLYYLLMYERKRALLKIQVTEASLQKKKLEEINELKSRFFANISHEFRTPLTLIIGPALELRERLKEKDDLKEIDKINQNSKQLLRLVNQLLDLSKLEANKLPVNIEQIDIVKSIKQIIENLKPLAANKGINLIFEYPIEKLKILFDRDILEKILNNLITNSIKFSESGCMIDVRLDVSTKSREFYINVTDNGHGIPKEEIRSIFDGFYRSSFTKFEQGYGIGLAYVKELVNLVNGNIEVSSELKQGTRFKIRFPLTLADIIVENDLEENIKDVVEPVIPEEVREESDGKKIILVIEDNKEIREYISEKLSPVYTVITTSDGKTGIEKMRALLPDLVISDIMMPEMDGLELCKISKSDIVTSHIPIILLTARADEKSKLEGFDYGADDYLTKPFSVKELLARINSIFTNRARVIQKYGTEFYKQAQKERPKTRDEEFMEKIYSIIYANISKENLSVEQIADEANMSYTQVYRKVKSLTGFTIVQLIQKCRLNKAAELLKTNQSNISEIGYEVGFSNPSYFAQCFRKEFNCSPQEYIRNS